MKKFTIPLVDKVFYIYVGEKEWEQFKNDSIDNGANESRNEPYPGEESGRAGGSWIWIDALTDTQTLYHELSHFIDHLMKYLGSNDDEFRAYLTSWVMHNVLKWSGKRK